MLLESTTDYHLLGLGFVTARVCAVTCKRQKEREKTSLDRKNLKQHVFYFKYETRSRKVFFLHLGKEI